MRTMTYHEAIKAHGRKVRFWRFSDSAPVEGVLVHRESLAGENNGDRSLNFFLAHNNDTFNSESGYDKFKMGQKHIWSFSISENDYYGHCSKIELINDRTFEITGGVPDLTKKVTSIMNTLKDKIKLSLVSEPDKTLIKAGLMSLNGEWSEDVRALALTEVVEAHLSSPEFKAKMLAIAKEDTDNK